MSALVQHDSSVPGGYGCFLDDNDDDNDDDNKDVLQVVMAVYQMHQAASLDLVSVHLSSLY